MCTSNEAIQGASGCALSISDVTEAFSEGWVEDTTKSRGVEDLVFVTLTLEASRSVDTFSVEARMSVALIDVSTTLSVRQKFVSRVAHALVHTSQVDALTVGADTIVITLVHIVTSGCVRGGKESRMADTLVTSSGVHTSSVLTETRLLATFVDIFTGLVGGSWAVSVVALAPEASSGVSADSVGAHTVLSALVNVNA